MNCDFILFLSCLETKALPFVPLQGDFLSIACPEAKGNVNFLALVPKLVLPCWADLPSPGCRHCLVCVDVTAAQPQEPKHHCLHPRAALQEFIELPVCRL